MMFNCYGPAMNVSKVSNDVITDLLTFELG